MIVLCCSFCPLKIEYDYVGLESFNDVIDKCVFFDNGLESRDVINSRMKVPVEWYNYTFTDHAKMRNDLIKLVGPDDYVFMIDDTYIANIFFKDFKKELKEYDSVIVSVRYPDKILNGIKIFKASKYSYVVRYHEVIYPLEKNLNVWDLSNDICILDLPDEERSISYIKSGIGLLLEDLRTFFQDNFLRIHIFFHLGLSYYQIGYFNAAKSYLKKALNAPPDSTYHKRARLLINEL